KPDNGRDGTVLALSRFLLMRRSHLSRSYNKAGYELRHCEIAERSNLRPDVGRRAYRFQIATAPFTGPANSSTTSGTIMTQLHTSKNILSPGGFGVTSIAP